MDIESTNFNKPHTSPDGIETSGLSRSHADFPDLVGEALGLPTRDGTPSKAELQLNREMQVIMDPSNVWH